MASISTGEILGEVTRTLNLSGGGDISLSDKEAILLVQLSHEYPATQEQDQKVTRILLK